jgi:hypothetical protein
MSYFCFNSRDRNQEKRREGEKERKITTRVFSQLKKLKTDDCCFFLEAQDEESLHIFSLLCCICICIVKMENVSSSYVTLSFSRKCN